ncbi:MAG: carbohydrate-binding domain-containing protein, partial [Paludibacteraceae bacterium]|nr:carbohydrate-binding domain-containing protein [Paludibacteraceae bacterium]
MRRFIGLVISGLAVSGLLTAQTLNVQVDNVTYQFPAAQTYSMPFDNGTTLTVMGKAFALSDIDNMYVDETVVRDSAVNVVYNGSSAAITVAGNIARYVTIAQSGAHVSIAQSNDLATEIIYNLSGSSSDGEFYISGSYKSTIELNGLTLTNTTPVYSGAAVHVQNSKRIKVKVVTGTTSTLRDASTGSQKGALYIKGHAEFAQKGTLNVYGNVKHGIKAGEYITVKNATINVLSSVGDGINCEQFFLMESGTISLSGIGDDGLQCDIEDTTTGSTGQTTDHEGEDSGNVYISGGTITVSVSAAAAKGIKSEGDMVITGGTITATTSGGGAWDSDDLKTKACAGLSADGNIAISGGTLNLKSTGAGGKGISGDGTFVVSDSAAITISTSGQAVVASS